MGIAGRRLSLIAGKTLLTNVGTQNVTVAPLAHGELVTTANTGYGAFFDQNLGRNLQTSDLQIIPGVHYISDFVQAGGVLYKKRFTGSIVVDVNNVTFNACLFDNPVVNYLNGVHASGTNFNWCTVSPDPSTPGDVGIRYQGFSAYRCYVRGCADGIWILGGATTQNIIECYVRVKMQDPQDHNDVFQNSGGVGTVNILRCNVSCNPEGGVLNGGAQGGPNSVLLSADEVSGASYSATMQDCLVEGTNSAYTIRLYDGALSTDITYVYTGNKHIRPGAFSGESDRGSSNTTPTNQITWQNNVWQDNNQAILLN